MHFKPGGRKSHTSELIRDQSTVRQTIKVDRYITTTATTTAAQAKRRQDAARDPLAAVRRRRHRVGQGRFVRRLQVGRLVDVDGGF